MAQKVQIILEDDIDGGKADETVRFSLDGSSYEIDLSTANASKLRDALAEFISAGRKATARAGAAPKGRSASSASSGSRNSESAKIRQWARDNGYSVNARGRIQQEVQEAYRHANG
ncbi:Lsr2 family protein [Sinomonas notoginsengisoli]|uniref:histone-like nucleoid-structuring protein Lsr2 n=1 Tax=Sinomonas notoginsengisoli TaxID=1457311 RepID=UPI001F279639|nr:Lsr2 family protein [Sinomonas notoginsengisoli]